MKATKQEAIEMEWRTLRKGIGNLFRQRHQFSRELRHFPTLFVLFVLWAFWLVLLAPDAQAPSVCVCPPPIVYNCDLPPTWATP